MKKRVFFPVLAAVLLGILAAVVPDIQRDVREESRTAIRDAVLRAATECYAVEGAYPGSLGYLEENYGLSVNHQDFLVVYDAFSSNIRPEVQVLVRGEG